MQLGVMLTLWLLVWGFDLSGDCCERPPWQRVFCPKCYSGCPRYDDGLVRLGKTLRSRLVGQADAIDVIATAFARPPAAHGVRSLLFIGNDGVGKTSAAHAIGAALFSFEEEDTGSRRGLMYLPGSMAPRSTTQESELRARIFDYVKECPSAVVVLDSLQKWPVEWVTLLFDELASSRAIVWDQQSLVLTNATLIAIHDMVDGSSTQPHSASEILHRYWPVHGAAVQLVQFAEIEKAELPADFDLTTSELLPAPTPVVHKVRRLIETLPDIISMPRSMWLRGQSLLWVETDTTTLKLVASILYTSAMSSIVTHDANYRGIENVFHTLVEAPISHKIYTFNWSLAPRDRPARLILITEPDRSISVRVTFPRNFRTTEL